MTADQQQLYQDLREWADKKGNWVFVEHLDWYYNYLKRQEQPAEIINQKPVIPLEDKLRNDWGEQNVKKGNSGTSV